MGWPSRLTLGAATTDSADLIGVKVGLIVGVDVNVGVPACSLERSGFFIPPFGVGVEVGTPGVAGEYQTSFKGVGVGLGLSIVRPPMTHSFSAKERLLKESLIVQGGELVIEVQKFPLEEYQTSFKFGEPEPFVVPLLPPKTHIRPLATTDPNRYLAENPGLTACDQLKPVEEDHSSF